jgi:serine/threonine protein kinase/Tol biopolymer transport system component
MTLPNGTKLGPYEIVSPLGAGGMGEVYRARDTRLSRDVAFKVLSQAFAVDAERTARFRREAQLLASLNHPNIASIYGFEDSGSIHGLVMELVEGPTLSNRIKQGAIPVDEALPIAKQIAEALEYAHEHGIIHRDLKPSNIKLANNEGVKVLDFGLAKAIEGDPASSDISSSPTISRMATQAGIILGTAAYMSPEQAKGKAVDRRTDIWAFGCVLYEMLTGTMPFAGETVTDTLAAVIRGEPDWSLLPASTPSPIRQLLLRCLKKDPRQRLRDIGDARFAIEEVLSGASPDETGTVAAARTSRPAAPSWLRFLPWALAAALGAGLLISLFALRQASHSSAQRPVELSFSLPPDQRLDTANGPGMAISPDGSRLAYVTQEPGSGAGRLFVRELAGGPPTLLAEHAAAPFFSPDGQWIGFFADVKLRKISVRGGAPIALCDVGGFRGGDWGEDGTIVFPQQFTASLSRIPAAGGKPELVTHLDAARSEITHRWPQFLPGGKAVLFTASADNNFFGNASIEAASLDTGVPKVLVENAYYGRYLPGGYLAYVFQGTVFVAPFDPQALKVTGTAVPVLQGVVSDISNGGVQFSVSPSGMTVYLAGSAGNQNLNIALLERKGDATILLKGQPDAASPRFSPDGKRLAFQRGTGGIWVHDLERGTTSPVTINTTGATFPTWTPDGERLAYSHPHSTPKATGQRIYWRRSDGTGDEEALTPETVPNAYPSSWSPDGKVLAFYRFSETGACCEIWTLTIDEKGKPEEPQPFLGAGAGKSFTGAAFSPDGRWVAYGSNESGSPQVYVVPFPGPGGKWQISTDNGVEPRWSKTGHELFYVKGTQLTVVPYTVEKSSFQAGKPQAVFETRLEMRIPFASYDVTPDGQHFVIFQFAVGNAANFEPTVVLNWLDEVRRLVAAGQSGAAK